MDDSNLNANFCGHKMRGFYVHYVGAKFVGSVLLRYFKDHSQKTLQSTIVNSIHNR